MAVTTLNDLAGALRSDNDKQVKATERLNDQLYTLVEQNANLNQFLKSGAAAADAERKAAAARQVEADREASAASAAVGTSESSSESPVSGSGSGKGFFGKLLTIGILGKMIKAVGSVLSTAKKLGGLFLKGGIFGAVIYGVYQIFKDIGENEKFKATIASLKKSWESIKTSWNEIVELFNDPQEGSAISGIKNAISGVMDWVASFGEEWEYIRCKIQDAALFIAKNVAGGIASALEGVKNFMKDPVATWNRWTAGIQAGWDSAMSLIGGAWDGFLEIFTIDIPLWFSSRKLDFDLWLGDVRISFTEKWEAFSGFFTETIPEWFETTKNTFVTAWDASKDLLKTKWSEVVKFFTVDVPKYFTDWLDTAVDNVIDPIAATWTRVVDWFLRVNTNITTKYEEIKAFGSDIISKIKDTWCNVVEFFTVDIPAKMKETWESIKAFGSNLLGTAQTGLKMYWDNLVDFYTIKIPAAMKAVWETIKAGGTGILDSISAKWESVKCFFTKDIPEVIDTWVSNVIAVKDNFMNGISGAWTAVTTFFTETIPTTIKEWIVPDFDLMGNITAKVTDMLTMIFDLIPSMEDIKNSLIKQVRKMGSIGQGILEFFGISAGTEGSGPSTTQQKVELNTKQRTEQGLKPFGPLMEVQAFNPKTGLMQDHNYSMTKTFLANEHDAMEKHDRDMLIPIVQRLAVAAENEREARKLVDVAGFPPSTVIGSVGDTTTTQSSVTYISPERYAYLDMFEAGTGRGPPNTWHLN